MIRFILWIGMMVAIPLPSPAAVAVFACEPEWGALAQEVGGDRVKVTTATTALQDPHHIQARPSLIARIRKADLVFCSGGGLEVGWLPLLLRRSNNPQVQPGQPGYVQAVSAVSLLDRPQRLDRAAGDVHAQGNPHIQTDPHNIAAVAGLLAQKLSALDPAHARQYQDNLDRFRSRWEQATQRWEQEAKPLRGMPVVVQHRNWAYLIHWLGLVRVATIEPKPGVPPSSADLAALVERLRQQPADAILRASYQDKHAAQWLSAHAGIAAVELPFTVGGSDAAVDLFALFDDTLRRLLEVKQ